ncbi:MAG: pilus assembly protein PilP [Proteobacteria bacterium]|nr:pilus assembly protein PilP [Pseudomonadota bacterium]
MSIIKILLISSLSLLLMSCTKNMSDLDRYFEDARNIPPQQIKPLPEINSPEVFVYEAEDERDPFSNDLQLLRERNVEVAQAVDGAGPDLNRRKEILENYPLDGLYMVGIYVQEDNYWGLIEDPEGIIHRVSKGEYMGQNYGKITAVEEDQISLSEWVSDGLGGWTQKEASLALRGE